MAVVFSVYQHDEVHFGVNVEGRSQSTSTLKYFINYPQPMCLRCVFTGLDLAPGYLIMYMLIFQKYEIQNTFSSSN